MFPITIPSLRRRREDIPALVAHFMERKSRELKIRTIPSLAPGALEQLQAYHWSGNVRELENLVERTLIFCQITGNEDLLSFDHLSMVSLKEISQGAVSPADKIFPLDDMIAVHIRQALDRTEGRVEGKNGAAKMLGLHPSTLRGRMRKLGIPYGRNG